MRRVADTAVAGRSDGQVATTPYDPAGRRIAKSIDGDLAVQYVYDGPQCIAEYDANDALLRTFIYGPGIDQPICMIETADANAAYYYHFDGLGSVIALSDDDGDTVVTYEYDAFGVPASSDPNHPNPFLFTGRRYDPETGLYHYRARAYNPYIGRFLQLDPAKDGMNWYAYCGNNGVNRIDPSGCEAMTGPGQSVVDAIMKEPWDYFPDIDVWGNVPIATFRYTPVHASGNVFTYMTVFVDVCSIRFQQIGGARVPFVRVNNGESLPGFQMYNDGPIEHAEWVGLLTPDLLLEAMKEELDRIDSSGVSRGALGTLDGGFFANPYNAYLYFDPCAGRAEWFFGHELNYFLQGYAHAKLGMTGHESDMWMSIHNWLWGPISDLLDEVRKTPTFTEVHSKFIWRDRGWNTYKQNH